MLDDELNWIVQVWETMTLVRGHNMRANQRSTFDCGPDSGQLENFGHARGSRSISQDAKDSIARRDHAPGRVPERQLTIFGGRHRLGRGNQ